MDELIRVVNRELICLTDWFRINKLSLNIDKTNYMVFSGRSLTTSHQDIFLCNQSVSKVQSTKFLGIEIDDKLSWKNHIQIVQKKLSTTNYILRNIRHKIKQNTAIKIYDTMALTHLSYCNLIWGNACKTLLQNVNRLQKRVLRICCDNKKLESKTLFVQLKKLTVKDIHYMQIAQVVHRYYYSIDDFPLQIFSIFEKASDIHSHCTRSADNLCLFTHYGRLNLRKNCVKVCAPTLWNKIPVSLRQINSIVLFKNKYKVYLINQTQI